jgi:hypothetical protein
MIPLLSKLPFFGAAASCSHSFLFFPNWWEYLKPVPTLPECNVGFSGVGDIWLVGLAIIDILLRLAGLVAIVAVMMGGITYMTSGGNPEKAAAGQKRILSALGGLAIVMLATVIVTFVGKSLGS